MSVQDFRACRSKTTRAKELCPKDLGASTGVSHRSVSGGLSPSFVAEAKRGLPPQAAEVRRFSDALIKSDRIGSRRSRDLRGTRYLGISQSSFFASHLFYSDLSAMMSNVQLI